MTEILTAFRVKY